MLKIFCKIFSASLLVTIALNVGTMNLYSQKGKKKLETQISQRSIPEYITINLDTAIFEGQDYRHIQSVRSFALPNNGIAISYFGQDKKTHFLFLNENDIQSSGAKQATSAPKLILNNIYIHSFVVHDSTIAYLYSPVSKLAYYSMDSVKKDAPSLIGIVSKVQTQIGSVFTSDLFLGRSTINGKQLLSKKLVGDDNMDVVWNREYYAGNSSNTGSDGTQIVWTGKFYSVIFPHFTHCEDNVNHQMDSWYLIDTLGNIKNLAELHGYANGKMWLTSHSFGQRLIYNPFESGNLIAVSANDAYPVRAINVHTLNMEKISKALNSSTVDKALSAFTGTQDQAPLIKITTPFDGLAEQLGKVFKNVRLDKFFQDLGTSFAKPLKDAGIFTNNAEQDLEKVLAVPSTQATVKAQVKQSSVSKISKNRTNQSEPAKTKKDTPKQEPIRSGTVKTASTIDSIKIKQQIQERNERRKLDSLMWEYAFNNASKDLLIGNSLFPISGETGDNYIANTQLGDIIPIPSGAFLTFCSAEKRDKTGNFVQDVGLLKINSQGRLQSARWLTFTPHLSEQNVHTSRIGTLDLFLVTWDVFIPASSGQPWERERTARFSHSEYVIIDQDGQVIRPETTFDKHYSGESLEVTHRRTRSYNCTQLSKGDVVLVRMTKNPKQLDLLRFAQKMR